MSDKAKPSLGSADLGPRPAVRRVVARAAMPAEQGGLEQKSPAEMLAAAHRVLGHEIERLHDKSRTRGLDNQEAKLFGDLSETLVRLVREQREQDKARDASDLTLDQLIVETEEALVILRALKAEQDAQKAKP